jgi:hypothetical protein
LASAFLSFDGAVVVFSDFSGLLALSVELGLREGGFGRGEFDVDAVESRCALEVETPFVDCSFVFVLNIRVNLRATDGLVAVGCADESDGGCALPFKSWVLGTVKPFCFGMDSGDVAEPIADEFEDAGGEGRRFSVIVRRGIRDATLTHLHPNRPMCCYWAMAMHPTQSGCAWVSTERANLSAVPHWQKIQASRCCAVAVNREGERERGILDMSRVDF